MLKTLLYTLPCAALLGGCTPAKFAIDQRPPAASADRQSLDNIECTNLSHTSGPWLFGLGWLIYKRMSATTYHDCMTSRGYTVHEQ